MKLRSTTPVIRKFATGAFVVVTAFVMAVSSVTPVYADRFDDQIRALQRQISGYQAEAGRLSAQADTLQSTIGEMQAQLNTIQAQLDLSQAKYDQLVQQIKQTEDKIARNKVVLKETIADLYVSGKVSPIEMLAGSKNIGDYLDQQEYRSGVRDKVEDATKEIKKLKKDLEVKRDQAKKVLDDQNAQKAALAAKKAEQDSLLAQTQNSEAAFQGLISQQNSQISSLRAQQAAANARFISGGSFAAGTGPACGGGYPGRWCNIPMDSAVDSWGMYNRQCVSYAAFKVAASGRHMPYWGGRGNANQWDDNARRAGIPVDSTPRAGSVAVSNSGYYGHVMYVESVNANGTINISQYNADWRGTYSTNTISPGGLVFIHF